MKKKFFIIAMCLFCLTALAACGDESSALVGRWEAISMEMVWEGESEKMDMEGGEGFEFFSDGKGASIDGSGSADPFTWTAENGRLMLTDDGETIVFDYKISGSNLTMTAEEYGMKMIMTLRKK